MSSLTFFLMFLHISAYSIRCCLLSPFYTMSRSFVIRARVGDDILDCIDLLLALATLDKLCCIMFVMVTLLCRCNVVLVMFPFYCSQLELDFVRLSHYLCEIYFWRPLGHQCVPFHFYSQFDIALVLLIVILSLFRC